MISNFSALINLICLNPVNSSIFTKKEVGNKNIFSVFFCLTITPLNACISSCKISSSLSVSVNADKLILSLLTLLLSSTISLPLKSTPLKSGCADFMNVATNIPPPFASGFIYLNGSGVFSMQATLNFFRNEK